MTNWDAVHYLKYADERTRPAVDLVARIKLDAPHRIADLGCGPGNSTQVLRIRWPTAELLGLQFDDQAVGFFSLDGSPSAWWSPDETPSLYLSGMVVARSMRGRGIGSFIIEWCVAEASRLGRRYVRLDCHAGNPWLCQYYEAHGFQLCGQIEQHPGYYGCLYQRDVESAIPNSASFLES